MNKRRIYETRFFAVVIIAWALAFTACKQPAELPTEPVLTAIPTDHSDTPLDNRKADLTVMARYGDDAGQPVNAEDFALNGTLTIDGSVLTVSYIWGLGLWVRSD